MSDKTVTVEVNQQQEQLLDRMVDAGEAKDHSDAIKKGFLAFCEENPQFLGNGKEA
jgi:Arc/MetJ-type ribon-helix-helix transcriptional regulator